MKNVNQTKSLSKDLPTVRVRRNTVHINIFIYHDNLLYSVCGNAIISMVFDFDIFSTCSSEIVELTLQDVQRKAFKYCNILLNFVEQLKSQRCGLII